MASEEKEKKSNKPQETEHNLDLGAFNANRAKEMKKKEDLQAEGLKGLSRSDQDLLKGGPKEELLSGTGKEELLEGEKEEKLLMDEKDTKLTELTESLKRVAAEFDNYKKRVAKETVEIERNGSAKMVEKLLTFLDELELAVMAAERSQDRQAEGLTGLSRPEAKGLRAYSAQAESRSDQDAIFKDGMGLLYSKFKGLLEAEGLQEMNPVGEKFDPYRHEAAMQESAEGKEEGAIVRVIRKGYMLNGKILRHAMVSVCKKNG